MPQLYIVAAAQSYDGGISHDDLQRLRQTGVHLGIAPTSIVCVEHSDVAINTAQSLCVTTEADFKLWRPAAEAPSGFSLAIAQERFAAIGSKLNMKGFLAVERRAAEALIHYAKKLREAVDEFTKRDECAMIAVQAPLATAFVLRAVDRDRFDVGAMYREFELEPCHVVRALAYRHDSQLVITHFDHFDAEADPVV